MTYISSTALTSSGRQSVMQAQAQLSQLQQELSSSSPADVGLTLGATSGNLISLTTQQNDLQSITGNNALVSTRLSSTQSALSALQTAASSFLANLTTAASPGNTTQGLQQAAAGDLQSLISTLNTQVGGQFIFSGINTANQPMQAYGAGSASKNAVDSAFQTAFGTSQTSAGASSISSSQMQSFLSGSFASLFSGSSYSTDWSSATDQTITSRIAPGQTASTSVSANNTAFQQLAQAYTMISEFGGSPMSAGAQQAVIAQATSLVSSAVSGLVTTQASVGVVQSQVTAANDTMSAQMGYLGTESASMNQLSDTQLQALPTLIDQLQTQIESSFEVTSKLQQMSLVNYLG